MFVEPFLDNPYLVPLGIILIIKKTFADGYTAAMKGCTLIGNNVQISCGIQMFLHFYQGAPMYAMKTPPTPLYYHNHHQPAHSMMDACTHGFLSIPLSSHQLEPGFIQIRQCFSNFPVSIVFIP
jgi:hypothetical protein